MKNTLIPIILASLFLAGCLRDKRGASAEQTAEVIRETLIITTAEDGTVEAEEKVVITNELRWPVIIKSVVEEGTVVKKGDLIIEFECKALEDAIDQKELHLNNADLALEQAKKDLVIAEKQHTINLERAKNTLQDAEENLTLYQDQSQNDLEQARNRLKVAQENLTLYQDQSQSNLALMEETAQRAKEALTRYNSVGGQKEIALRNADIAIDMAGRRVEIAEEKLAFKEGVNENPKLNEPYSKSEIESDELSLDTLKNTRDDNVAAKELLIKYDIPQMIRQLEENVTQVEKDMKILKTHTTVQTMRQREEEVKQAERSLEILKTHTTIQTMRQRTTAVKEAQLNLDRAILGQEAELKWKKQEIKGKDKELKKHQEQMEELKEDDAKLIVTGERAGLVLYTPGWKEGGLRIMLEEGESVYPRAQLMQIPDMTTLRVKTMLFEALREYVTVAGGQKENKAVEADAPQGTQAMVVLDAFAQKTQIIGQVVESSPLPKNTGPEWLQTGTKAYDLHVGVDWEANGLTPGKNLRPGMGGKVTLLLDEIEHALTVPVLSVYNKKNRYYCMKLEGGTPTETEITLGKMNESRVQVLSGLTEGDRVLLVAKAEEGADAEESGDEEGTSSDNSQAGGGK